MYPNSRSPLVRPGHQHVFAAAADAPTCPSAADVLGENQVLLSESQTALVGTLLKLSQEHLFQDWPPLGSDDDKKVGVIVAEKVLPRCCKPFVRLGNLALLCVSIASFSGSQAWRAVWWSSFLCCS
jgi:hypothetical protein